MVLALEGIALSDVLPTFMVPSRSSGLITISRSGERILFRLAKTDPLDAKTTESAGPRTKRTAPVVGPIGHRG